MSAPVSYPTIIVPVTSLHQELSDSARKLLRRQPPRYGAKKGVLLSAVIKRINRRLAHDGEQLRTLRNDRCLSDFGRYYIVNDDRCLIAAHVDPDALARELDVLKGAEVVI